MSQPQLQSDIQTDRYTLTQYDEAADFIREHASVQPAIGLVLGSGLSALADIISDPAKIPYERIPHFPVSTVEGHAGRLIIGHLNGVAVCVMQGRFHFYEGYTPQQVTFPIRVMARLGIKKLILTNAAGGVNPEFRAGDLMVIDDHVNFLGISGANPLHGPNLSEFGPRFPSMTNVYDRKMRQTLHRVAQENEVALHRGVYGSVAGPSFETPAEIRFLRTIGIDAVGMSTAPEATVAVHAGLSVLGISSITNVAVDSVDTDAVTSHEEVMETGRIIVPRLTKLILGVVKEIG